MSDFPDTASGAQAVPAERGSTTGGRPKVLFVGNLTTSLTNFRYDLLKELAERADVLACAPENDATTEAALAEIGVTFRQIPMARAGLNPFQDMSTLFTLIGICREIRPDIVFAYTMKPIIFSGLAARLTGVRRRFAMCTGLGYVFADAELTLRRKVLRAVATGLYRIGLKGADEVLVYNSVDAEEFRSRRLLAPQAALSIVPGSGVNLARYAKSHQPTDPPVFLMIARLLRDKGVFEYAEAARQLREQFPDVRCQLLGPLDDNPDSVNAQQLEEWGQQGHIEYLGETKDVRPFLKECSVFVLPTVYREGIPRAILEAMSTGRAVITTDAPGCADAVSDGENGFIVPKRNPEGLADAMRKFVEDRSLIESMGQAARARAEQEFDVARINTILLRKMGLIDSDTTLPSTATD